MKANIFGKGKKRKKDKSGSRSAHERPPGRPGKPENLRPAGGGRAGCPAGTAKSQPSGPTCASAENRERPKGCPDKQTLTGRPSGGTCRSPATRERPKGRPSKQTLTGRPSGQARHAAEARERPRGRPSKQTLTGRLSGQARRSAEARERPRGRPGKQARGGPSAHDSYFRKVFSKKRYTPNIFKLALPEKLYNLLDWSSLEVEMKTFLSEEMRERRTDILCSVKIKNGGGRLGLLFLLEHRSHQGKDIHQILLEYQTPAYRALKMPIIPIVPYSGKRPKWTQPLDFHGSLLRDFKSQLSPAQSRAAAEVWDAIKGHVLNFRSIFKARCRFGSAEFEGAG